MGLGMPWYRPTRVNHATSGSELGWRSGTAKWPAAYPDSLPAMIDIGPGSPAGAAFGYGKDPAKYQKAFYICDWTWDHVRHSPDTLWFNIYSRERGIVARTHFLNRYELSVRMVQSILPLVDVVVRVNLSCYVHRN